MRKDRTRQVSMAIVQAILFAGCAGAIRAQSLVLFDACSGQGTIARAINDSGEVAGVCASGPNFIREPDGTVSLFDVPGAVNGRTSTRGINDRGEVTGYFYDALKAKTRGFLRDSDGHFTVFDGPGADYTVSYAINNRGDVTGFLATTQSALGGFVRSRKGQFAAFTSPEPYSINNRGDIAGHNFIREWNGKFVTISPPNAVPISAGGYINATSINDPGDVVGYYWDGIKQRGFLRDRKGDYTSFDAPNDIWTIASSINNGGDITGMFAEPTAIYRYRGYLRDKKGKFFVFDAPDSGWTEPTGMNNSGDVVGVCSCEGGSFIRHSSFPPASTGSSTE